MSLALALTATLTAAGCSAGSTATGSGGSASGGAKSTALTVGLVAEPANLDFTRTDGAAIPQALLGNVYDGLVKLDNDGKIVPDLATTWTVSPDRKTYTFDLTGDATFTNGAKFTAEDAVFSINRVKKDWTISLKSAMDVVQDAKALSPTQLQVTLAKPSNDWLFRMTTRIGAMFSQTGVDKLATDPVGTGPYKLTKWNRGDSIALTRNDSYFGTKPLLPDRHAEVLQGPDRAQQRAADRHHQRHRHGAGAGVARAVLQQRQVPGHRGHHQRRGRAVVQQRARPR